MNDAQANANPHCNLISCTCAPDLGNSVRATVSHPLYPRRQSETRHSARAPMPFANSQRASLMRSSTPPYQRAGCRPETQLWPDVLPVSNVALHLPKQSRSPDRCLCRQTQDRGSFHSQLCSNSTTRYQSAIALYQWNRNPKIQ